MGIELDRLILFINMDIHGSNSAERNFGVNPGLGGAYSLRNNFHVGASAEVAVNEFGDHYETGMRLRSGVAYTVLGAYGFGEYYPERVGSSSFGIGLEVLAPTMLLFPGIFIEYQQAPISTSTHVPEDFFIMGYRWEHVGLGLMLEKGLSSLLEIDIGPRW